MDFVGYILVSCYFDELRERPFSLQGSEGKVGVCAYKNQTIAPSYIFILMLSCSSVTLYLLSLNQYDDHLSGLVQCN
jgi:hypothetical protein